MSEVLAAFAALFTVGFVGYLAGRVGVLRPEHQVVLSRLAFFIATPALLFSTVAEADLAEVFSTVLITNVGSVLAVQLISLTVGLLLRRRRSEVVIGVLAASYVNAGNLGLPLALYVLGDAALIAPVLLFQLLVLAPVSFLLLDTGGRGDGEARDGRQRPVQAVVRALRNPLTLASVLGLVAALVPVSIPEAVLRPVELLGAGAVPVTLIAYGLSLVSNGRPLAGASTVDITLAVTLKVLGQPLAAYLIGVAVLGLHGSALLPAVLLAALPTAQNVYVYAMRYRVGIPLVRATVLLSTFSAVPVVVALTGLLSP